MFNLNYFKTMKAINVLCITALALFLGSCSKDDENAEEQKQDPKTETKVVTWDQAFCSDIDIYIDDDGQIYNTHNTKDGITVTISGEYEFDGFFEGDIQMCDEASIITFTSTVGKIKKIEILETDPIDSPTVPFNWRYNAQTATYTWEGNAAPAVTMKGVKDNLVYIEVGKIVFTVVE